MRSGEPHEVDGYILGSFLKSFGVGGNMRKLVILLVATLGLTLSGCALLTGSDGIVYGEFGFASGSSVSAYLEGFPSGTLYSNTYYEVAPGLHEIYYRIYYNGEYFPGNSGSVGNGSANSDYWWYATYTVTANSGSFPWKDGDDKYFSFYLNRNYGLQLDSGDATIESTFAADKAGRPSLDLAPMKSSWTSSDGNVTVTVSSKIVQLAEEDLKALPAQAIIVE
jgi:hypothetical protein